MIKMCSYTTMQDQCNNFQNLVTYDRQTNRHVETQIAMLISVTLVHGLAPVDINVT